MENDDDVRRTTEAYITYKLTKWAFGSGELIMQENSWETQNVSLYCNDQRKFNNLTFSGVVSRKPVLLDRIIQMSTIISLDIKWDLELPNDYSGFQCFVSLTQTTGELYKYFFVHLDIILLLNYTLSLNKFHCLTRNQRVILKYPARRIPDQIYRGSYISKHLIWNSWNELSNFGILRAFGEIRFCLSHDPPTIKKKNI